LPGYPFGDCPRMQTAGPVANVGGACPEGATPRLNATARCERPLRRGRRGRNSAISGDVCSRGSTGSPRAGKRECRAQPPGENETRTNVSHPDPDSVADVA
jgi:hypothetical protein